MLHACNHQQFATMHPEFQEPRCRTSASVADLSGTYPTAPCCCTALLRCAERTARHGTDTYDKIRRTKALHHRTPRQHTKATTPSQLPPTLHTDVSRIV